MGLSDILGYAHALQRLGPTSRVAGQETQDLLNDGSKEVDFRDGCLLRRFQAVDGGHVHFLLPNIVGGGDEQSVVIQGGEQDGCVVQFNV